jgi:hypothetical protein
MGILSLRSEIDVILRSVDVGIDYAAVGRKYGREPHLMNQSIRPVPGEYLSITLAQSLWPAAMTSLSAYLLYLL